MKLRSNSKHRGEEREAVTISASGVTSPTLPPEPVGLDKMCRLHRKQRRGAAVVEFAIVAPLFFLLVFGMIEYGRMVMVQQIITNASREGARRAVLDGATANEVDNAVTDFLEESSIQGAEVEIQPPDPSTAEFGDPVTVSVSIGFDQVSWLPSPMYLGGQELRASTVMRRESAQ